MVEPASESNNTHTMLEEIPELPNKDNNVNIFLY